MLFFLVTFFTSLPFFKFIFLTFLNFNRLHLLPKNVHGCTICIDLESRCGMNKRAEDEDVEPKSKSCQTILASFIMGALKVTRVKNVFFFLYMKVFQIREKKVSKKYQI